MGSVIEQSQLCGFEDHLRNLEDTHRRRSLTKRRGHDFASNDYLGFAQSPFLKQAIIDALERGVPIGSGGSRLLRGNHREHELLEQEASRFFNCESALLFSSGYAANSSVLSTLPQSGDLILYDELIHASSHEGMRLARAPSCKVRHNDPTAFSDSLSDWRSKGGKGRAWIVVESLYSMDGDKAPLGDLMSLSNAKDAVLVIDEAHATGVFGTSGRGLSEAFAGNENVVTIRTCGKALGCEGALVCCPSILKDFLVNRARGFIFSTAPSPLMASAIRAALQRLERDGAPQKELHELCSFAQLKLGPFGVACTGSQILPLIVGNSLAAIQLAQALQERGFDVRAIRPPTVPDGTARLRFSITLNVDRSRIDQLRDALEKCAA